jgi:hypothetical protein
VGLLLFGKKSSSFWRKIQIGFKDILTLRIVLQCIFLRIIHDFRNEISWWFSNVCIAWFNEFSDWFHNQWGIDHPQSDHLFSTCTARITSPYNKPFFIKDLKFLNDSDYLLLKNSWHNKFGGLNFQLSISIGFETSYLTDEKMISVGMVRDSKKSKIFGTSEDPQNPNTHSETNPLVLAVFRIARNGSPRSYKFLISLNLNRNKKLLERTKKE